jgi:hypothetical protein
MSRSIYMIAAPDDYDQLSRFVDSIGLQLVPPLITHFGSDALLDPVIGPFCYLSFLEPGELHPYGDPPIRISDATDPLLEFLRPYYDPPHLIDGRLHWKDYPENLAARTKPYFDKLFRWVRANWKNKTEDRFWTGPVAFDMLADGSAQHRSCVNGISVESVGGVKQRTGTEPDDAREPPS